MSVGRDIFSRLKYDYIADDHLFSRNLADIPFADHLHENIIIDCIQNVECSVCFDFEKEADARSQHDGKEYADRFEESAEAFSLRSPTMYAGDNHG